MTTTVASHFLRAIFKKIPLREKRNPTCQFYLPLQKLWIGQIPVLKFY